MARMQGDTMVLTWNALADTEYTVLYAEDLVDGMWKPLPDHMNVAGTGKTMEIRVPVPEGPRRFYRLHMGHY